MAASSVMDNLEQIQLIANNLIVRSSLNKVKIRKLKISNPTSMEIAFKLCDTSLPDFILIEPDHGYIKPHDEVKVTITILPFDQESDYETPVEEITTFFCKAPSNKNVNVFTEDYPWPEESRATQMVIKFLKENEGNSPDSRSDSEKSSVSSIDIDEFGSSNEPETNESESDDN